MAEHSSKTDVVVIGGGAAGMMCAAVAGKRGRRVVLLEHNEHVGRKIQISGGGRCNFTNLYAQPANYLSAQPSFAKSAMARYTPQDFIRLVERYGISYHEKKLGQLFCDTSSREIIDLLVRECTEADVRILTGCRVSQVTKTTEGFQLESTRNDWHCESLVIATGGLSFPKLGASDFGYRIARQFGLQLTETRPGLVPLTFRDNDKSALAPLSGVALPVAIQHNGKKFEENLLITHRGISGPAVLQISSYWRDGETLEIDLMPGKNAEDWLRRERKKRSKMTLANAIAGPLPQRFAKTWCECFEPAGSRQLCQLSAAEIDATAARLNRWQIPFASTEGYRKAEVTLGGIATSELSSRTMEARRAPGLYFIGEVVDVTGWLGGYNFQWAWASGNAAGEAV